MFSAIIAGVFRRAATVNGDANKKGGTRFRLALSTLFLPALALVAAPSAHGALLGVTPYWPDITTTGYDISNTFVSGVGGTLTINGNQGTSAAQVGQTIKFFSGDPAHNIYGCSTLGISTTTCATPNSPNSSYVLTANFDASGAFTSGTLNILGYIDADTTTAGYQAFDFNGAAAGGAATGTLLTASLYAVGFLGSAGGVAGTLNYDLLKLDVKGTVTGGDFYNTGYDPANGANLIMNATRVFSSGTAAPGVTVGTPFTHNFTCGNGDAARLCQAGGIDTFIPVPAAAWLFGSGLIGLLGVATRSRETRKS